MGQPLLGKRAIADFFGVGWRKVSKYIALGAPIVKGQGIKSPYEADRKLLEDWWEWHIQERLEKS